MENARLQQALAATADGVTIRVKVVPGASRTKIVAMLGDRVKLAVAAPAQGGQANRAVCACLARAFDLSPRDVIITSGQTRAQKTVDLIGVTLCQATQHLQRLLDDQP